MSATLLEIIFFFVLITLPPLCRHKEELLQNTSIGDSLKVDNTNMLRGLAILMVMLMHSSCDLGLRCFTPLGGIGVSLFLLLSGYGLAESFKRKGLTDFWKNKFSKIWIPYIIVLIVLTFIARSDVNWWQLLFEAVGINSRFWFVSFLLYNYLLFYVCYKSTRIYEYRYFLMGVFALCIFLFDNRIRAEQALSFMSGVFLSDYKNVITSSL